jgi:hypothetical protein
MIRPISIKLGMLRATLRFVEPLLFWLALFHFKVQFVLNCYYLLSPFADFDDPLQYATSTTRMLVSCYHTTHFKGHYT